MGHSNDMNSLLVVPENDLERKLLHTTRSVPSVNPNEPFRIGLNVRQRDVYGNAEVASGGGTAFCDQSADSSNSAVASG